MTPEQIREKARDLCTKASPKGHTRIEHVPPVDPCPVCESIAAFAQECVEAATKELRDELVSVYRDKGSWEEASAIYARNMRTQQARAEKAEAEVLRLSGLETVGARNALAREREDREKAESKLVALTAPVGESEERWAQSVVECTDGGPQWKYVPADSFKAAQIMLRALLSARAETAAPKEMVLYCPAGHQHIDENEWATKPHKKHKCQVIPGCIYPGCKTNHGRTICGLEWRPANFATVGVLSLPIPDAVKRVEGKS